MKNAQIMIVIRKKQLGMFLASLVTAVGCIGLVFASGLTDTLSKNSDQNNIIDQGQLNSNDSIAAKTIDESVDKIVPVLSNEQAPVQQETVATGSSQKSKPKTTTKSASTLPVADSPSDSPAPVADSPSESPTPTKTVEPTKVPDELIKTLEGIAIRSVDSIYVPMCQYTTIVGSPPPCVHYVPVSFYLEATYSDGSIKRVSWNDASVSSVNPNGGHPFIPTLLSIDAESNLLKLGSGPEYFLGTSGSVIIPITVTYQQLTYTKYIHIYIVR